MDVFHDIPQAFFTNLQLLGFDAVSVEKQYRIPCNKEMFNLPNKKGFEAVMYFLFNRLDGSKCRELFRDCWPVRDKKDEQLFRRACHSWLSDISKEEENNFVPRINPSLLMSPGGEKFHHILLALSTLVLQKCTMQECGVKQRDFVQHPKLTPQTQSLGPVLTKTLLCASTTQRMDFMQLIQQNSAVHDEWRQYISEEVKTYRKLSKSIRETERQLRGEIQRSTDECGNSEYSFQTLLKKEISAWDKAIDNINRADRIQKIRELWRQLQDFCRVTVFEHEVIDSVLDGTVDGHRVDATQLNVRIPDVLLRECEQEIQRRQLDNIYLGGKLNLFSLINLWNLSLHLFIDKLHHYQFPNFDKDLPLVKKQLFTNEAHLQTSQALRIKLEKEVIPHLKERIRDLSQLLDDKMFTSSADFPASNLAILVKKFNSILYKGIGFGLVPPTPPVSFAPSDSKTPADLSQKRFTTTSMTTPQAAEELVAAISNSLKKKSDKLQQGTPLYAPKTGNTRVRRQVLEKHAIADEKQAANQYKTTTRVVKKGSKKIETVKTTPSGTQLVERHTQPASIAAKRQANRQVSSQPASIAAKRQANRQRMPQRKVSGARARKKSSSGQSPERQVVIERHVSQRRRDDRLNHSDLSSIPRDDAHDLLAQQLVDDMIDSDDVMERRSYSEDIGLSLHLDQEAFHHRDLLARTPPPHEVMQDSYGPLSSTRVEDKHATMHGVNRDRVTIQLFPAKSPGASGDEDDMVHIDSRDNVVIKADDSERPDQKRRFPMSADGLRLDEPPPPLRSRHRQETYGAESSAGSRSPPTSDVNRSELYQPAVNPLAADKLMSEGRPSDHADIMYEQQVEDIAAKYPQTPQPKRLVPKHQVARQPMSLGAYHEGMRVASPRPLDQHIESPKKVDTKNLLELSLASIELENTQQRMQELASTATPKLPTRSEASTSKQQAPATPASLATTSHSPGSSRKPTPTPPSPRPPPPLLTTDVVLVPPAQSEPTAGRRNDVSDFSSARATEPTPLITNTSAPITATSTHRFAYSAWMEGHDVLTPVEPRHDVISDPSLGTAPTTSGNYTPLNRTSQNENNSSLPFHMRLTETPDSRTLAELRASVSSQDSPAHNSNNNSFQASPVLVTKHFDRQSPHHRLRSAIEDERPLSPAAVSDDRAPADHTSLRATAVSDDRAPADHTSLRAATAENASRNGADFVQDHATLSDDLLARYRQLRSDVQHATAGSVTAVSSSREVTSPAAVKPTTYADSLENYSPMKSRDHGSAMSGSKRFTLDFDIDSMDSPPSALTSQSVSSTHRTDITADSLTPRWQSLNDASNTDIYRSPRNKMPSPRTTSISLSPLTSRLHALPDDVTPTRRAAASRRMETIDVINDIFGEDDSILLPPSPLNASSSSQLA